MATLPTTFNVGEVTHTLTMKVVGIKSLRFRTWLAGLIIKLAAVVLGTKLSVELLGNEDFDEKDLPPAFDGSPYRNFVKVGDYAVPTACAVDERSPLYHASYRVWGPFVDILLDGVVQTNVLSFDIENAYIRRHFLKEGELAVNGDEIANEVVRGKVELRAK